MRAQQSAGVPLAVYPPLSPEHGQQAARGTPVPVSPEHGQQAARGTPAPPSIQSLVVLNASGKGRHTLQVSVRLKLEHRGGWRAVEGVLPSAPASALAITVPQPQTEVRLTQVADRRSYETQVAGQKIETALSPSGGFGIQWRPKVGEGQVDRSLTVQSDAVLDVQEDGLRLVWQSTLEFRRSQRDAFRVSVPAEYLVEKVEGGNVRGREIRKEANRQTVDITLLKTAKDSGTLHLAAVAPRSGWRRRCGHVRGPYRQRGGRRHAGRAIDHPPQPAVGSSHGESRRGCRGPICRRRPTRRPRAAPAPRTAPWESSPTRRTSSSARPSRSG